MKAIILGSSTTNGFRAIGLDVCSHGAGWVENLIKSLSGKSNDIYAFFVTGLVKEVKSGTYEGITYFAIPDIAGSKQNKIDEFKSVFDGLIKKIKPDLVHIIGTEREYNYALFKAFNKPEKTVISITGLVTYCAYHYLGNISKTFLSRRTIGDILRRWGPLVEKNEFTKASIIEQKLLNEAKYVFGRTSWDEACVSLINPKLEYVHCEEILNDVFYSGQWSQEACTKHTIFVSQASYPIKGFHILIEALSYVLKRYPDTKVIVAGNNPLDSSCFISKVKRSTYGRYLQRVMKKNSIDEKTICFTGLLKPEEMRLHYLNANVAVLPSVIENSPNSLGEAMCLGTPCVASYVGGVPDMIENRKSGLLYPSDEPYMLAKCIMDIFENPSLAETLSLNGKAAARSFFNKQNAINTTYKIYEMLASN